MWLHQSSHSFVESISFYIMYGGITGVFGLFHTCLIGKRDFKRLHLDNLMEKDSGNDIALHSLLDVPFTHEFLDYIKSHTTDIACTYFVVSIQVRGSKLINVEVNPSVFVFSVFKSACQWGTQLEII